MQLSTVALLTVASAAAAHAAAASEVAFLTALVGDYNSHKKDYLDFVQTAANVPSALSGLALQVRTYTDDSYTTLLDNSAINVPQLELYATNLPWYTRIQAEVGVTSGAAAGGSSASETGSAAAGGSTGRGSTAVTSAPVTSGPASSGAIISSLAAATPSSSKNGNTVIVAPLGAVLGAFAVALM